MILKAEPVMNPKTAGIEMNSNMKPNLNKPKPMAIQPQIKDKTVAITGPGKEGSLS